MDEFNLTQPVYTADELRAMLREAEAREKEEAQRRAESVKPTFRFTLKASERFWDEIFDDTVVPMHLDGRVTNKDELEAVGARVPQEGGHHYLYNTLTKKFIMGSGGGMCWIGFDRDPSARAALIELAAILESKGTTPIDVTDIVNKYRKGA